MRLIDADALIERAQNLNAKDRRFVQVLLSVCQSVDAVPVVRCAECIHYEPCEGGKDFCCFHAIGIVPDDFCSYGERKVDA